MAPIEPETDPALAALTVAVERHAARVSAAHAPRLQCRRGCAGCCGRHITFSAVEVARLAAGLSEASGAAQAAIRTHLAAYDPAAPGPCPLLIGDACALYAHRPTICRTQGLPLQVVDAGKARRDVCPLNFEGGDASALAALSNADVLDLDRLNTVLGSVALGYTRRRGLPDGARMSPLALLNVPATQP